MKKVVAVGVLLAVAVAMISCAGSKVNFGSAPLQMPNVSGSWEFILSSTTMPGSSTGLEAALQEGQTLDTTTGLYYYNGQISASSSQLNFVGFTPGKQIVFGGNCAPAADNTGNSLAGSISGVGGSMNFTFTENGNVFNVTATLDASETFIDSGTYTAQSGSGCNDSGTIVTGNTVPKITGQFSGPLTVNGNSDTANATLSESSGTLTMDLILTGHDNTSLTLTGPVTGNFFFVQGTFEGGQISYYGYYEPTASVPTLYLATVTEPSQQAGLLKQL